MALDLAPEDLDRQPDTEMAPRTGRQPPVGAVPLRASLPDRRYDRICECGARFQPEAEKGYVSGTVENRVWTAIVVEPKSMWQSVAKRIGPNPNGVKYHPIRLRSAGFLCRVGSDGIGPLGVMELLRPGRIRRNNGRRVRPYCSRSTNTHRVPSASLRCSRAPGRPCRGATTATYDPPARGPFPRAARTTDTRSRGGPCLAGIRV